MQTNFHNGGYVKQYYHQQSDFPRSTLSVEIPTKDQLIHFLNDKHDRLLMLYAGFALVHPKDRFHKKVGREVADSKLKPTTFRIKQITFDDLDNMEFKLIPIDAEERIKF